MRVRVRSPSGSEEQALVAGARPHAKDQLGQCLRLGLRLGSEEIFACMEAVAKFTKGAPEAAYGALAPELLRFDDSSAPSQGTAPDVCAKNRGLRGFWRKLAFRFPVPCTRGPLARTGVK